VKRLNETTNRLSGDLIDDHFAFGIENRELARISSGADANWVFRGELESSNPVDPAGIDFKEDSLRTGDEH